MKRLYSLPLAVGLLLSQAAQAAPPVCPSAKFPLFLAKYADSVALQKAFTDYPLTHVLLNHAVEPKPKQIKVRLDKAKVSFPLIPANADRKREGLVFRIDTVTDKNATATLVKDDTGYKMAYFFRKDGCWKLERKEDQSL